MAFVYEYHILVAENRHFGETNMNARSSRSHTIFRMVWNLQFVLLLCLFVGQYYAPLLVY